LGWYRLKDAPEDVKNVRKEDKAALAKQLCESSPEFKEFIKSKFQLSSGSILQDDPEFITPEGDDDGE
jgi:hypothetical protein